jgi:hypothetical protein
MPEFPWEVVYNYFTEKLISTSKDHGQFNPMLFMVRTDGLEIDEVDSVPQENINEYFEHGAYGQAQFFQFVKEVVSTIEDNPFCLVFVSEAYAKTVKFEEVQDVEAHYQGLKNDPGKRDVVVIQIYRPEGMRMGMLPLGADGSVTYAPLTPAEKLPHRSAMQ